MAEPSTAWSAEAYASLEEILRRRAGLIFHSLRRDAVQLAATRVMRRIGIASPNVFVPLAAQDGAVFDDLMAEVTIGETYFFREPGHFALLRDTILPEFHARRVGAQPFRAWSAAASTGEEPYSIAIALQEQRMPGIVVGTDVSRARLATARRAQYRKWSFRGVPESVIDQYFRREPDDTFVLVPSVRREVEFRYLNLASDSYPSMSSGVWGMDLILCRNVLIYFDRDTIAHVARSLLACLAEDGWILLGATDPPLTDHVDCDVVQTKAGLAYRHKGKGRAMPRLHLPPREIVAPLIEVSKAEPSAASSGITPAIASVAAPRTPAPNEPARSAPALSPAPPANVASRDSDPASLLAAEVKQLANAGRLEEAGRACAAALDRFRDNAELHYLHAVLVAQAGQFAESARAAKRAIYLDRSMVVAHLALGSALLRSDRRSAAARAFATASRLLSAMPPDEIVPFSDGEPAGRLLEMTRVQERLAQRMEVA
jgi:chemotaxis protein methyltransferase CheR